MALHYSTEYRLGRRGRVCRTYSGPRALVAIAVDLALGSVFGVIGLALGTVRWLLRTALRLAVAVATFPIRAMRWVGSRVRRPAAKPAWAGLDEL